MGVGSNTPYHIMAAWPLSLSTDSTCFLPSLTSACLRHSRKSQSQTSTVVLLHLFSSVT